MRIVEKMFENSLKKAGIKKNVSIHALIHSFVTRSPESGVELRYIQEILEHNIYTDVSVLNFGKIKNPLNQILQEDENE